jgi:hypothetical protein
MGTAHQQRPRSSEQRNGSADDAWVVEVSNPRQGRVIRASLPLTSFGAPDIEMVDESPGGYEDPFERFISRPGEPSARAERPEPREPSPGRPVAPPAEPEPAPAATPPERRGSALLGLGALAAAAALIVGIVLIAQSGGDDSDDTAFDAPASGAPAGLAGIAELGDACRIKFDRAVLSGVPLARFEALGITPRVLRPAVTTSQATFILPVRASNNVVCGQLGGVVGLDGGLRLQRNGAAVELRRLQVNGSTGAVRTVAPGAGAAGAGLLAIDLGKGRWVRGSEFTTYRAPLALSASGAAELNDALGTTEFSPGDEIGVISLTGDPRAVNPDLTG